MDPQLSLDEMAAQMAENMNLGTSGGGPIVKSGAFEKGGGLGDMPGSRAGSSGAEGGFTPQAGGKVIDAAAKGEGAPSAAELVSKAGAYTGAKTTMEPGRQGDKPKVIDDTTREPKGEVGGGSGEGGNLGTSGDEGIRGRKSGKIGIAGGEGGGQPGEPGLPQGADESTRGRKSGKVGINKSVLIAEIAKAQNNLNQLLSLAKADVEIEVGDDDDDDDEAEKGKTCKSDADEVGADELVKALDILENIGEGVAVPAPQERSAALAKGLSDGTLTSEEMVELADLMKASVEDDDLNKGGEDEDEDLNKSFQEQWGSDPENQEDYDASPFLERFGQQTAAGLDQVQESLSKSLQAQQVERRAFNTQLAKSLKFMAQRNLHQENLIKSLQHRLSQVENTPLPRAGVSGVSALNKSMDGEVGAGQQLDFEVIGDTLVDMSMTMEKSPCGEDLRRAMASFETTGDLSKSLYRDVVKFRSENQR
jgi:hypothetical protein